MGFIEVESCFALTMSGGVFRQVPIYERENIIYAKAGSGFIRLHENKRTSHPKTTWVEIDGVRTKTGKFGYLELKK